jgi:hypothetical protein
MIPDHLIHPLDGCGGCAYSRFLTRHCTTARGGAPPSPLPSSRSASARHIRQRDPLGLPGLDRQRIGRRVAPTRWRTKTPTASRRCAVGERWHYDASSLIRNAGDTEVLMLVGTSQSVAMGPHGPRATSGAVFRLPAESKNARSCNLWHSTFSKTELVIPGMIRMRESSWSRFWRG